MQPAHRRPPSIGRLRALHAIPSNLLFFEKTGPTKEVWFYEIPSRRAGRVLEDQAAAIRGVRRLPGLVGWQARRGPGREERAWSVAAAEIAADGYNLDCATRIGDELAIALRRSSSRNLISRWKKQILEEAFDISRSNSGNDWQLTDAGGTHRNSALEPQPTVDRRFESARRIRGHSSYSRAFGKDIFQLQALFNHGARTSSKDKFFRVGSDHLVVGEVSKASKGISPVAQDRTTTESPPIASSTMSRYDEDQARKCTYLRRYFLAEKGNPNGFTRVAWIPRISNRTLANVKEQGPSW